MALLAAAAVVISAAFVLILYKAYYRDAALPIVELRAGDTKILAEVAADKASRSKGLMFRERLETDQGMLFVYETPAVKCFWMKNTKIPLSVAFIDDSGAIVKIDDLKPFDESPRCSGTPVLFALEMEQGWFERHGIAAGTRLNLDQVLPHPK